MRHPTPTPNEAISKYGYATVQRLGFGKMCKNLQEHTGFRRHSIVRLYNKPFALSAAEHRSAPIYATITFF